MISLSLSYMYFFIFVVQHETTRYTNHKKIVGARSTISVWEPKVANPVMSFSLSQLWIAGVTEGDGKGKDIIEAGWHVSSLT